MNENRQNKLINGRSVNRTNEHNKNRFSSNEKQQRNRIDFFELQPDGGKNTKQAIFTGH